jgi:peptide methionine sulfoxide reductase MsrA
MSSFPKPSLPSASLYYSARSDLATGVYRWNHIDVYRKPTELKSLVTHLSNFCGISGINADYHRQYLAKNPDGYCGLKGTGVSCAIGGNVGVLMLRGAACSIECASS